MSNETIDWADVAAVGLVADAWFDERPDRRVRSLLEHDLHGRLDPYQGNVDAIASALREAFEAGQREGQDAARQQFIDWRGVETPCQRCGGSGVRTYSSTATWHGGAGGQTLTSAVCDGCWGSGDATRTGANLRKLRAESDELREAHEAGLRESGNLYTEHSRALDRLLEQAEELAALRRELDARRAVDGWLRQWNHHLEAEHDGLHVCGPNRGPFHIEDPSYHAHIRAAALACHCCPVCCSPPCDGCLAGGVCDDAECRCNELDEYRRDEDPHD